MKKESRRERGERRRTRSRSHGSSTGPKAKRPAWVWKVVLGLVVVALLGLIYGCLGGA